MSFSRWQRKITNHMIKEYMIIEYKSKHDRKSRQKGMQAREE